MTALPRVDSPRAPLPDIHRLRAALAALLAFALIAAASIVGALPARAVGGAVVANVSAASTDGLAVHASATGLDGVSGAYVALIPRGGEGAVTGSAGAAAQEWVRAVVDGQLAVTLTAPTAALDRTTEYEVIVWQQHSAPSAENIYARADVVISGEQWDAVFPPVQPELPTPSVTVSKTAGIDPAGETVTVTGTGFVAAPPATTGARPPLAGKFTGAYVAFGSFLEAWQPSAGAPASARKAIDTRWGVLAADMAIIGGANAGAIELSEDGSFSTTLTLTRDDAAALEGGRWGVYTYPGGGAKYAPFETYTPITFAEPVPAGPSVTVSKTAGIDPAGETVTVTGTGFVAAPPATTGARPPLAGKFTGAYVAFGSFLEAWQPSAGAPASARKAIDTRWGVLAADMAIIGGANAGAIELSEDGSFSTTLTLTRDDAAALEGGRWGVYTYPGGGAKYAPFETYTPITFAEPVPAGPSVTVSKTAGIDPAGETVTVTGTGFVAAPPATTGARPPLAGKFTGAYVAFGSFLEAWQPSAGAPASARKAIDTRWGVLAADMAIIGGANAGAIELSEDGSFSTTLTLTRDDAAALEGGRWGVYTYPGGGAKYAPFETYTPITFAGAPDPEPTPEPTPPTTPPAGALDAGSLRWGISAPFAAYITGPIAQGTIGVSQGATRAGGVFQFGQAAGSSYDPATGVGTVSYTGAVRYTGHGGLLDVSLANPTLQILSPGTATLTVSHGGARVHLATVALSAGTTTRNGDTVTITGAPTTLAASGVGIFQNNYPAGSALEPLTVTIGAPAAAPAGATGTVASAPAPAALRAIPAAPPATTGIALDDVTRAALEAGREVTLRASGFGAGERDIFAVVYSTPTVLERELVADADGVVSWTGVLPASLANGEHTFTFQGSVARGIQFTLERDAAAAIGSCVVTEASLSWGFMTTFRNYIEGIGGGGWALEGVEYRYPSYVWPTGTGSIDPGNGAGLVDFGGVIRFTGHDGALDTTLANTRIELVGETGYLVIDVSGTTQSGSAVDAAAVRFATFAVPEGAWDAETGVLTLSDVPTSLTADGAAAFGSYPAGTALDPLSATIAVNAECLAPEDEVLEVAVTSAEAPEAVADAGAPVWPWVAGGIALLVIIAGAWVFAVRRRAGAVRE